MGRRRIEIHSNRIKYKPNASVFQSRFSPEAGGLGRIHPAKIYPSLSPGAGGLGRIHPAKIYPSLSPEAGGLGQDSSCKKLSFPFA
jgi:hypothetical protein